MVVGVVQYREAAIELFQKALELDPKDIHFINADTEDGITVQVEKLKERYEEREKKLKMDMMNGDTPQAGSTNSSIKEMTKDKFDSLDAAAKMEAITSGTKII